MTVFISYKVQCHCAKSLIDFISIFRTDFTIQFRVRLKICKTSINCYVLYKVLNPRTWYSSLNSKKITSLLEVITIPNSHIGDEELIIAVQHYKEKYIKNAAHKEIQIITNHFREKFDTKAILKIKFL